MSLLNFPFLTDDLTQKHVIKSRVMFIMRGLPGSGKSTIVRLIREKYQPITDVVVCSADDYFLQEDGSYNYDKVVNTTISVQCGIQGTPGTHDSALFFIFMQLLNKIGQNIRLPPPPLELPPLPTSGKSWIRYCCRRLPGFLRPNKLVACTKG